MGKHLAPDNKKRPKTGHLKVREGKRVIQSVSENDRPKRRGLGELCTDEVHEREHEEHEACSCREHGEECGHEHCRGEEDCHCHGGGCSCHEHGHVFSVKDVIIVSAAALVFAAALLLPFEGLLHLVCFVISYLIAGFRVLKEAAEKIVHGEFLEEDFLMSIASIGAFCIGEYPEAVMVMLLYRIGSLFESYALGKSRKSVSELMNIRPDHASLESEEGLITVSPEDVLPGHIILVTPGERVPLDGEIIEGMTSIDSSSLTGESVPVACAVGSRVLSGSINISSPIRVRVTSSYAESTVSRILELVEGASAKKSKHESFITRFARVYTPAVVISALLIAVLPPIFGAQWAEWIRRAIVFLVVSCPCALVISVPLSYFGGIGSASSNGILVKGSNYLEMLAKTDIFVFDKTGTITEGKFAVSEVYPEGIDEEGLLSLAATAEHFSNHPIAKAIKAVGEDMYDGTEAVLQVEEIPGRGVSAFIGGKLVLVGNATLLSERGIEYRSPRRHGTAVHVAEDGKYRGHIIIADKVKEGAFEAVEALRYEGARNLVMLTGDVLSAARPIASSLNFDMVKAELLPDGKVSAVEYLLATKADASVLAFVGDGVNDAPVLACADVGIAMGAMGSDAAIEAADIVLMDDDIRKISLAVKIAKKTIGIVKQNIYFSLLIKFGIIALGLFGKVPVGVAVFGDVGVLIIAIINSLRTLKIPNEEGLKR